MADTVAQRPIADFPAYYRDFDGNFWEQYSKSAQSGPRYYLVPPSWQEVAPTPLAARNEFMFRVVQGQVDLGRPPEDAPDAPHYYMERNERGAVTYRKISGDRAITAALVALEQEMRISNAG